MNIITALVLSLAVVIMGAKGLSMCLTDKAKEESAAKYEQQVIDKDKRLASACAAGQTGVIVYYKGVDCASNRKG